jgi:hypothetical protein
VTIPICAPDDRHLMVLWHRHVQPGRAPEMSRYSVISTVRFFGVVTAQWHGTSVWTIDA